MPKFTKKITQILSIFIIVLGVTFSKVVVECAVNLEPGKEAKLCKFAAWKNDDDLPKVFLKVNFLDPERPTQRAFIMGPNVSKNGLVVSELTSILIAAQTKYDKTTQKTGIHDVK